MGQGKEMTDAISKADLTRIIYVLCEKLNWTEEQKDCANNPKTRLNNKEDQIIIQKGQDTTKSQMDSKITDLSMISEQMDTERPEMQGNKEDKDIPANFENIVCDDSEENVHSKPSKPILNSTEIIQGKYSCSLCDQKFSKQKFLEAHSFLRHSGQSCDAGLVESKDLKQQERIQNSIPFSCSFCEKKFSKSSNLKRHERLHTSDKPFSCSQCDFKCTQSGNLKIHERIHTGDKPFSCSHCDYKCSDSSTLKKHERIHTGDKPYSCSQCDYKCTTSGALKTHERIHTDEKPFSCLKCDKAFTTAGHLKTD